ncbi:MULTISPECIES: MBL fold metallo-hydrolase [unclassified Iodidimonas]|jgi:glyoxylase-like metal-dependent hydrolase (beta-lactamase superfamily II)|uniref:MBL fold metallo-hydrolase n=1 Tax=unclassified Iodidimonas TaxID=2626145 RepID=UPI002482CF95|nr:MULTISPECIES: MBL fold metallo-hydrolase [unclassified Iodidimonas]
MAKGFDGKRALAALLLAAGLSHSAAAQRDFSDVEIKIEPVAGNVHVLYGAGGNIGVLTSDDGVILIDDQFAPLTDRILEAIASLDSGPVKFLLNTHWHGDHTGGNENLGEGGVVIVAHDHVYRRLAQPQRFSNERRNTEARPKAALPVLTFNDQLSFHLGEDARAYHMPHAHTDGDSIIHFPESNVIHMGDLLFVDRYPFIDIESGGNLLGVIDGVIKAMALADEKTTFIGGHGPLADRERVRAYLNVLETARDRVRPMIADGKSLEDVIAARPMAAYDEAWGSGFINPEAFLRAVYESLKNPAH